MRNAVIYIHGKGGSASEAEHYRSLFPSCEVLGFDYHAGTPWEAGPEFREYYRGISERYDSVTVIANSIGAYFCLTALEEECPKRYYLISPILDMEALILAMMSWAGVTEQELEEKCMIETGFGETLSWEYLCWVREHPIRSGAEIRILRGELDTMQSLPVITACAEKLGAAITVMEGGEHWFHTPEQMEFLDCWIRENEALQDL